MSIRQRADGRWEQAVRLVPGGRVYVSVTAHRPVDVTGPAEVCAGLGAAATAAAAAMGKWSRSGDAVTSGMRAFRRRLAERAG